MHSYSVLRVSVPLDTEPLSETRPAGSLEVLSRQVTAEQMDVARCPRCRAPLVARMSCRGPYFFCLCAESAVGPK